MAKIREGDRVRWQYAHVAHGFTRWKAKQGTVLRVNEDGTKALIKMEGNQHAYWYPVVDLQWLGRHDDV